MDHASVHQGRGRGLCGPGRGAGGDGARALVAGAISFGHTLLADTLPGHAVQLLIATIRRLLVLTAEFARLVESNTAAFRAAMLELGLLTLMIVALVVSLVVLKRHTAHGS